MEIPAAECGRFIGKGGENIKRLQRDSDARLKICHDDESNGYVPVLISGSNEAQDKAKKLIEEFLNLGFSSERSAPKSNQNHFDSSDGDFDWDQLIADSDIQSKARWAGLVDIKKDFYIEDSNVSDMSTAEAKAWRKENHDLEIKDLSKLERGVLNPVKTFKEAFFHYPDLLAQVEKQGFAKPSPIQSQVWPLLMKGYNVIGIAQTGTGKTLGFLLPALIHIDMQIKPRKDRVGPSALILTPTRELALQIEKEVNKYSYKGIRSICVYGGGDRRQQIKDVMAGVEIVVATPGRFNDLLENQFIKLDDITFLILDEADRMLDMGFEPQIGKILIDIRPDRQMVMTSATWPTGVERMASRYLVDPFRINVGSLDLTAARTVEQIIEYVDEEEKRDRLFSFINDMTESDKAIVFVGKRSLCDALVLELHVQNNFVCTALHGGLEQMDRETIFEDFKNGDVRVLIATDLVSRGLDVSDITHVINFDFPRNIEEYVHRVGRTGRAGRKGISISFVTRNNWRNAAELIKILEKAEAHIPDELHGMARRFSEMQERRDREGGYGRRDGGGGGGYGRRGGGRRGGGGRQRW